MTDIAPGNSEPDDNESAVRLMSYADCYEIEALITTVGYNCDPYPSEWADYLKNVINAYSVDVSNLMKRSGQKSFMDIEKEDGKQSLGYWPSADYLRGRVAMGSTRAGIGVIGEGNDSPGSDLIIRLADENDDRPIWLCAWGSANTFAQAVWRIKQERSPKEVQRFLSKFRLYTITDQDMVYSMRDNLAYSSHQWLRRDYPHDLLHIWDESAWLNHNALGRADWEMYEAVIQGKGSLGRAYPKYLWGVEGDTPSFLHLMPNGLNDPDDPMQAGWGGCHEYGVSRDMQTYSWTNWQHPLKDISSLYEHKFYPDEFNDFAARMEWADKGKGNHNPTALVKGCRGLSPTEVNVKAGKTLSFDASRSYDEDGDGLSFLWWFQQYPDVNDYPAISDNGTSKVNITLPDGSSGTTYHLICEIHDDGPFRLTAYHRIVIVCR